MPSRFQMLQRGDGQLRWRLLSGNYKVLGVGPHWYGNFEAVIVELARVRSAAVRRTPAVHRLSGGWKWTLDGDEGGGATSSRSFARRVEAEHSAARFCAQATIAPVHPVVATYPSPHAHRGLRS